MKRPRTLGRSAGSAKPLEQQRDKARPWRRWYGLAIWKRIRAQQLALQPYCERHLRRSVVVLASIVNHVDRHNGDWDRFISGPFESLCKTCHDSDVQREEKAAARVRHGTR